MRNIFATLMKYAEIKKYASLKYEIFQHKKTASFEAVLHTLTRLEVRDLSSKYMVLQTNNNVKLSGPRGGRTPESRLDRSPSQPGRPTHLPLYRSIVKRSLNFLTRKMSSRAKSRDLSQINPWTVLSQIPPLTSLGRNDMMSGFIKITKKGLLLTLCAWMIILGSGYLYLFKFSQKSEAAWFNEDWAYRKAITFTHNAAVSNTKVKFDIDTTSAPASIQADCGDIRFTDASGVLLRYYFDSAGGACDTASSDFYVLMPSIISGSNLLYIYYGNPQTQDGTEAANFSEATTTPSGADITAASEEKAPSPTAYWKFDDGTGTAVQDSTINNLDLIKTGSTWATEDMCISGKCLQLNGTTSDYASIADNDKLDIGTSDFTVSAWVKIQTTANINEVIIEKRLTGTPYTGYVLYIQNGTTMRFEVNAGTLTDFAITLPFDVRDNKWHHFAVSVDRDNASGGIYYFDGKPLGTPQNFSTQTASIANTAALYIGRSGQFTDDSLKGFVDEVKVYPYARSAAQIQTDYNNRSGGDGSGAVLGASNQKALSDGLVGYWKMDESSSNANDSSGNSQTLTNTNTATFVSGKYGNAGNFASASSQYFACSDANCGGTSELDIGSNNWSVAAWFKTSSTGVNQMVITKGAGGSYSYQFYIDTSNKFQFNLVNSVAGNYLDATSTSTYTDGTWHHAVGVFNQSTQTATLYIDGNRVAFDDTTTGTLVSDSTGAFEIGRRADAVGYFNGNIDEARVYSKALTPNEVSQLYNFAPGPTGYWNFEETTPTTTSVVDKSGNSYTGTWATSAATHYQPGKFGKGSKHNSSANDLVTLSDSGDPWDFGNKDFTINFWHNSSLVQNSATIGKRANNATFGGFVIYSGVAGSMIFYATSNGSSWDIFNGATIASYTVNTWEHFAITRNGSTFTFYKNGIVIGTGTSSATILGNTDLVRFGGDSNGSFMTGGLDDIKIYNYARTAKQVVEDMNGGHPNVGSPVGSALAHFRFDEGYGTTANNSGNGGSTLNGTLSGMSSPATTTSGWTQSGKFGKGLIFDGVGDQVLCTEANCGGTSKLDFGATDDLTISAWVKTSNVAAWQNVVMKGLNAGSTPKYNLRVSQTTGFPTLQLADGTDEINITGTASVADGNWHQLVVTNNHSTAKLYVDGKLAISGSSTSIDSLDNATSFYIGALEGTATFVGSMDEIKVYRYALTASEIITDYNKGSSLVLGASGDNPNYDKNSANQEYCVPGDTTGCAAPIARWDFNERTGTTTQDSSGNANTGTLTNGPRWTNGKGSPALSFDGTDDYVSIANRNSFPTGTNSFTVSGWFKTNSFTNRQGLFVYGNGTAFQTFDILVGSAADASHPQRKISMSNNAEVLACPGTSPTLNTDTWYHFAVTKSGANTYQCFINGISTGAAAVVGSSTSITSTLSYIGARSDGTQAFNGILDNFRMYNYIRTAAQIAYDYNKGGPIGHWRMDECQGTAIRDSSGNNNTGTLTLTAGSQTTPGTCTTSAVTPWYNGRNGKLNYSLNFDGTDDTVSVPSATSLQVSDYLTISVWIYPTSVTGTRDIVGYFGAGGSAHYKAHLSSGLPQLQIAGSAASCTSSISTNTWTHLVWSFNRVSGITDCYINGKLDKRTTGFTNTPTTPANPLYIGSSAGSNEFFSGQIDDLRIFNYAATSTQVKNIMNEGSVRFGPLTGSP